MSVTKEQLKILKALYDLGFRYLANRKGRGVYENFVDCFYDKPVKIGGCYDNRDGIILNNKLSYNLFQLVTHEPYPFYKLFEKEINEC